MKVLNKQGMDLVLVSMKEIKTLTTYSLLVLVLFIRTSSCFPNGPPTSVCSTGLPLHRKNGTLIPPQETPPPFKITVNTSTYKPGDVINVKVDGINEMFKGLFLQIRPVKKSKTDSVRDVPLGAFRRLKRNTEIMGCDIAQDTLAHEDGYVKFGTEFNWVAPLLMKNDIVVRATILANYTTYWVNVESDIIRLQDVGPLPAEALKEPWLREIISTVQKKGDKKATEDAIIARFEKGFDGALDPDGRVMIHYIMDLLPFEDSTKYGKPSPPPGFNVDDSSDTEPTAGDLKFDTSDKQDEKKDSKVVADDETSETSKADTADKQDGKKDSKVVADEGSSKMSKADTYFEVLVKAVIGGDKLVADALEKLMK